MSILRYKYTVFKMCCTCDDSYSYYSNVSALLMEMLFFINH